MPIDLNVAKRRRTVIAGPRAAAPFLGVELRHVTLQRGGRQVLRDLQWRIRPGERWLLQGSNGAGKTQLLKILAGDVWPQPGSKAQRLYTWNHEQFSEPWLVREQIAYLGAERQDRYEHYHWNQRVLRVVATGRQRTDIPLAPLTRSMRAQVLALLRSLGLAALAQRRFLALSYGERRLVLLARALAWQPGLLLLDEPLNGLDAGNRRRFLKVLQRLRASPLPIVYATHRLEEMPAGITHRAMLQDGRLRTASWPLQRLQWPQRLQPRSGQAGGRASGSARRPALPRKLPARSGAARTAAAALLRLSKASIWREGRAVLRGISLELGRGERVVVHGANGSGKSTLLGALYGEYPVAAGSQLWRRGVPAGTPLHLFQRRVGRISPELQLALPRQPTALQTVVAGLRGCFALDAPVTAPERRRALRALRRVGAVALAQREFGTLSYGQARRVLFARALAGEPRLLLLDEPYTGLDRATRTALRSLVDSGAMRAVAIVLAAHHRDDWPHTVTQELELAGGVVRYCGRVRRAAQRS
jgi:molybdate transport system ATP-binding protein